MQRSNAPTTDPVAVLAGSIAFVLGQTIAGVAMRQTEQEAIAPYLGHNTGGPNTGLQAIPPHEGALGPA